MIFLFYFIFCCQQALVIESSIDTRSLNGQSFPGGYVIADADGVQIITGAKAFRNSVGVNVVDLDSPALFNGVDLGRIILLSGSNFISGTTTFRHLEVTDFLKVRIFEIFTHL